MDQKARHSRCYAMSGLIGSPLLRPAGLLASLTETFTSGLSTDRSPSPSPDMTTVATGQFPPAGLPLRMKPTRHQFAPLMAGQEDCRSYYRLSDARSPPRRQF